MKIKYIMKIKFQSVDNSPTVKKKSQMFRHKVISECGASTQKPPRV